MDEVSGDCEDGSAGRVEVEVAVDDVSRNGVFAVASGPDAAVFDDVAADGDVV